MNIVERIEREIDRFALLNAYAPATCLYLGYDEIDQLAEYLRTIIRPTDDFGTIKEFLGLRIHEVKAKSHLRVV